jgi:hypothetical protein
MNEWGRALQCNIFKVPGKVFFIVHAAGKIE